MLERLVLRLYRLWPLLRGARLGAGARVHPSARVTRWNALSLGENALLYWRGDALIGARGRLTLGADSHLAPYFYLLIGNHHLSFGHHVAVGPRSLFFCHSNGIPGDVPVTPFTECHVDGDIRVGDNVFIGAGCIVLPGCEIGDNVVLAAGSVAKGRLESGWLYAGTPAKKVRQLC